MRTKTLSWPAPVCRLSGVFAGLQIKAHSPALLILTSQLSAKVGRYAGYLAIERAIAAGGYSAETLWFNDASPEGGKLVVNRSVELIRELWKP